MSDLTHVHRGSRVFVVRETAGATAVKRQGVLAVNRLHGLDSAMEIINRLREENVVLRAELIKRDAEMWRMRI